MTTVRTYREELRMRLHRAAEALLPFTDEPAGYIPNEETEADDFMLAVWKMDATENTWLVTSANGVVHVYLEKAGIITLRGMSPDGVMCHTITLPEGWYMFDMDRQLNIEIGDQAFEYIFNLFDRTSLLKLLAIVNMFEEKAAAKTSLSA